MAAGNLNEFMQNIDERVLECTICFKRFQNPVTLNCLHSYCLRCLENWTKTKGEVTCPTCGKQHTITTDDLKKLPPNTFLNNLLETIEQFDKLDEKKCVCEKEAAINYCQECQQYLCVNCNVIHKKLRGTSKHKLYSVENLQSMTQQEFNNLHPLLCSNHEESLKYFCEVCNVPICVHCTIIEHKEWQGKHKVISISEAYKNIKETAEKLKKTVKHCRDKLENGLKEMIQKSRKLEKSKEQSLKDIENHENEMMTKIKESADKLRNEVETKYKNKKKVSDVQMDELSNIISDVDSKVNFLDQSLKSDEATAVESSDKVIKALKDRIEKLPKTVPDDNVQIYYLKNKNVEKFCNIGKVTESRAAELTLQGGEPVKQGQSIVVKISKSLQIPVHKNEIIATWTQPCGTKVNAEIDENSNGDYTVTTKCTKAGVCRLDVTVDDEPIKNSPIIIKVEKEGLVNTFKINGHQRAKDVVKCEDDCLLVSCQTNKIHKYKQSGKYICDIILPEDVKVNRMCRMKKGNIVFSDAGYQSIKVCNMNGEVIKSFGEYVLECPEGVHVDEVSNVVYVADPDENNNAVFIFDINCGKMIRRMKLKGNIHCRKVFPSDVHLTKQGNILVLDSDNSRLILFDNEGMFIKVLVKAGDDDGYVWNPHGLAVDDDDNIIITSQQTVKLFNSDGEFIKRIDKDEDEIRDPGGLAIISLHPRKIAVSDYEGDINILNY